MYGNINHITNSNVTLNIILTLTSSRENYSNKFIIFRMVVINCQPRINFILYVNTKRSI